MSRGYSWGRLTNVFTGLLRIIDLVQADRTLTPLKLASKLGVTERSLFRYLSDLRGAGFVVYFDKEVGGYCLPRSNFLRPIDLTLDEALALATLAERMELTGDESQVRPGRRAMEKIRSVLPSSLQDELTQVLENVRIDPARSENAGNNDVRQKVEEAIRRRRALRCEYESTGAGVSTDVGVGKSTKKGEDVAFRLDPYALYFGQRAW